ncbi:hypothetical protein Ple7327_4512 [Pleurocapsa sp. PCC 7327]|uniref:hypothetical protein n=1 Tax=Pleurocapsa sp. PCC 7327 TaxID=118163 RepID=UPI00029FF9E8|nr:hypothetical protein [Pleurocapsa sp. PCC 7327]AFY79613.1 hypothetical protein Ple7327_4512 [Pleurocapsa sp. PCC 7327]
MSIPVLTIAVLLDKMSQLDRFAVVSNNSLFTSVFASAIAFLIPFAWLCVMAAIVNPFTRHSSARSSECMEEK